MSQRKKELLTEQEETKDLFAKIQQIITEKSMNLDLKVQSSLSSTLSVIRNRDLEIQNLLESDYVKVYDRCPHCNGAGLHVNNCLYVLDVELKDPYSKTE